MGFADEMARLAEEVADLGMVATDAFKYAAEALFGPDTELAAFALETAAGGAHVAMDVHQKSIAILARWSPIGADLKRVVELQRTSTEFARIAANARQVAEQIASLPTALEDRLARLDPRAPRALAGLVHQVYIALRGCLLLLTSGDRGLARRLIAEDSELERLYTALESTLTTAIARQPQLAPALRSLALAVTALRHMGVSAVAICEDRLS